MYCPSHSIDMDRQLRMTYELDHIFILSDVNAPSADKLVDAGITEGEPNIHRGQGTTNRRFFFNNSMIEYIWIHDEDEASNAQTKPTYLLSRWQGRASTSPFGICFRPTSDEQMPPFPAWDYTPKYLPDGMSIQIANTVNQLEEPFLFFAATAYSADKEVTHPAGMGNITAVEVTHPHRNSRSQSIDAIQHIITFTTGDKHLLTITFDDHQQGKTLNFQPDLPLIIRY